MNLEEYFERLQRMAMHQQERLEMRRNKNNPDKKSPQ